MNGVQVHVGGSAAGQAKSKAVGYIDLAFRNELAHEITCSIAEGKMPEGGKIAVHAWPKEEGRNRYGIGPVVWGDSAESWFDVVGDYDYFNDQTKIVCQLNGWPYISMR